MSENPTPNQDLLEVLEGMRTARARAGEWVKDGADFDPESQRLMDLMNTGDEETITAFINWIKSLDHVLPVTTASPDGGRRWQLIVDTEAELSPREREMLEAMAFLLFDGPDPGSGNAAVNELSGLGLPEKLRRDLSDPS